MHFSSKISAIATLLPLASALALGTTVPSVNLISYVLPECTGIDAFGVEYAAVNTVVNADNCTSISPPILSFQAFLKTPCPAGTTAEVTVYGSAGCAGKGVVETGVSPVSDACMEDIFFADGTVTFEGRSALFTCVES